MANRSLASSVQRMGSPASARTDCAFRPLGSVQQCKSFVEPTTVKNQGQWCFEEISAKYREQMLKSNEELRRIIDQLKRRQEENRE